MESQNYAKCATCGTTEKLLRCAKCKTIFYCSTAHQHMDWPRHKSECRILSKQLQLQQQLANTYNVTATSVVIPANVPVQNNLQQQQQELQENNMLMQQMHIGSNTTNLASGSGSGNGCVVGGDEINNLNVNNLDINSLNKLPDANTSILQVQQQQKQEQDQAAEYVPQFSTQANNQLEKSSSYQIGQVDMLLGNVNERRYEDLCRNIINDMNEYGLSVVDDFLGMEKGLQILNEVHRMYSAGVFKDGQLVNNTRTDQDLKTIRGDKITWVKGTEPNCTNVGYLINQIDNVICRATTMMNNGKLGQYEVKERTKAMVACYPGSGSQYVMHVDNPNKDGRVITAIYYLNRNWNTEESGGLLRIFPEHGDTVADIEPRFDRLIFFWSDKRNPHEVQPAHRTRYAITVWYFDANEREAALNKAKFVNPAPTIKPPTIMPDANKMRRNNAVEMAAMDETGKICI